MHVALRVDRLLLLGELETESGHQVCMMSTFTHGAISLIQRKLFLRNSTLQAEHWNPRKSATRVAGEENDSEYSPAQASPSSYGRLVFLESTDQWRRFVVTKSCHEFSHAFK